jgi:hypothetical protein
MTKVRMSVSISGSRDGEPWPPVGDEVTLPDEEAASLVAAGYAEPAARGKAGKPDAAAG